MSVSELIIPNYSKDSFEKLLNEYPTYPQERICDERFIAQRVAIHSRPAFCDLGLEVEFADGVVGEFHRKVEIYPAGVSPQLEDRVSFYRGGQHLGSTRVFKVIDQDLPFRIIMSQIAGPEDFKNYLLSVCHLVVYLDKIRLRCVGNEVGFALRYGASIAAVTLFCLAEEEESFVVKCQDIIIAPLPRVEAPALESIEIKCAGEGKVQS